MNSWKQFSLTNRKARQDFEGLGELFSFLFSESGSIYFIMLLGFVAAETIDEADFITCIFKILNKIDWQICREVRFESKILVL